MLQILTALSTLYHCWKKLWNDWFISKERHALIDKKRSKKNIPVTNKKYYIQRRWFLSAHIHTHPLNGPSSGTTRVSRYEKGKTNLDFTDARDSKWQWHQLGHMQAYTSLQTDNHANTQTLSFYRPDALPAAQPTASVRWRQMVPECSSIRIS